VRTSVSVDGSPVRSYTVAAGRPSAAELVMLPGLGAVDYLVPFLSAARRPTTVLDLPGYWGGRARSCGPRIADIASRCARWLEVTQRRGVVLAGHSTGAQSALRVAAACPDRVAFLLLLAPTFDPAARPLPGLLRLTASTFAREDPRELRPMASSYSRGGGWPVVALLRDGLKDRPEATVASVPVPVGVVAGSHDRIAPPSWAAQLAQLAGGRVAVVAGAHNFCFTAAEPLARVCEELIAA
jgi:pimeloyl-ACP methyl ester carboxylesterase